MLKALKVTMIVLGVVEILFGLGFIFFMQKMGKMLGFEPGPNYILPEFCVKDYKKDKK
jgi:hypothetical protein